MSEHVQEHGIRNTDNHSSPAALAETGILTGGELSGTIGLGVYDIAAGTGFIVDYSNPLVPIPTEVSWSQVLGTPIAGNNFHTVYVDSAGVIQKKADGVLTAQETRENIRLGIVVNVGGIVTQEINSNPIPAYNTLLGIYDWLTAVGGKVNGSNLTFGNADLTFDQSSGTFTFPFVNYKTDKMNPSALANSASTPASFFQQYEDGVGGFTVVALTTIVDPDQYDDGTGTLASLANNKWTFKPVFYFGDTNRLHMIYGQDVYNSKDEAISGISEDFNNMTINSSFNRSLLLGFMVLKKGTTDLTVDADFSFIASNQVSGGSTTSTNPGGSDTQVQFNDAGSFGGDADLIWDKTGKKLSLNGQLLVANGTEALPSVAFINDPDTGMYRSAANQLDLVTGGSLAVRFDSSQNVLMGKTALGLGNRGVEWNNTNSRFIITTDEQSFQSLFLQANHASFTGDVIRVQASRAASTAYNHASFYSNSVNVCDVRGNGDLINANGVYATISDTIIKKKVKKATSQIDDVERLGQLLKNFYKAEYDFEKGEVVKDKKGKEVLDSVRHLGWVIDDEFEKEFSGLVKKPANKKGLRVLKQSIIPNKMAGALSEVITALKREGILK